jgi:hypothetical protein
MSTGVSGPHNISRNSPLWVTSGHALRMYPNVSVVRPPPKGGAREKTTFRKRTKEIPDRSAPRGIRTHWRSASRLIASFLLRGGRWAACLHFALFGEARSLG